MENQSSTESNMAQNTQTMTQNGPDKNPDKKSEKNQVSTGEQAKKSSKKALIWIIVSIAILLVGGLVTLAVIFGQSLGKTIFNQTTEPKADDSISESDESFFNIEDLQFENDDTKRYVEESDSIFNALDQSLGLWSEAADYGVAEDFENSTAKLEEALSTIEKAEDTYQGLKPNDETEKIHQLLGESLELARSAMEAGIRGNNDINEEAITQSGELITQLSDKIVEVLGELEGLVGFEENALDDSGASNTTTEE